MRNDTVARRYARALFELAVENRSLADTLQALSNLRLAMASEPRLSRAILNPLVKSEAKQRLFAAITSNKLALKFLALLDKRKRLDLLSVIHEHLQQLNDRHEGITRPLVRTALPLTDEQRRAVEKQLAASLGGKVLGRFEVSADLIGGTWVQIGDKVLDATVRGRLQNFRAQLLHSNN